MFEKDAEEYANGKGHEHYNYLFEEHAASPVDFAEWCFKDGFKDGYNKANEWHYVKDGKYPTDDKKVLCILGDFENDNIEVGYYSQVEGDSKRWRFENYDLPDDSEEDWGVSAWKEIILPELKENDIKRELFPEITLPEGSAELVDKVIADAEKRLKEIE